MHFAYHCNAPVDSDECYLLLPDKDKPEEKEFRQIELFIGTCSNPDCQHPEVLAWRGVSYFGKVCDFFHTIKPKQQAAWLERLQQAQESNIVQKQIIKKGVDHVKGSSYVMPYNLVRRKVQ